MLNFSKKMALLEASLLKDEKKYLLFFFVCTFFIRFIYIFTIDHLPLFDSPTMDAGHHHTWALDIANNSWVGATPFIRSPLYPYVLGIIYKIFGVSFYLPRTFMAVLGAFNVLLIYKIAKRLFSPLPAFFSAMIAMLSWVLVFYDGELLITSVGLFFILCIANYATITFENKSVKNFFVLGILFGLAALARANYLPIIFVFFVFYALFYWRKIYYALFYALGALLIIAPVTIRNYVILDDFVPISFYTGVNFYIGNNPYADGRTAIVPNTRADWYGGVEDVIRIAQESEGRNLKPSEVSVYWSEKAIEYIKEQPFHFIKNIIKKFSFVFDLRETSNNKNIYFFRDQSWFLKLFSIVSGFLYIPFAIVGIVSALRKKEKKFIPIFLLLVCYIGGLTFSFVYTRLRHPIIGLFIVFAGYGIYTFMQKKNWRLFVPLYIVIFACLLFVSSKPKIYKDGYFSLANAYMRKSNFELAEKNYKKAIGLPEPYHSRIYKGLAESNEQIAKQYFSEGRIVEAEEYLRSSLEYEEHPARRANLAMLYIQRDPLFAIEQFKKVLALEPNTPFVYFQLAQIYHQLGMELELQNTLQKVSELDLTDQQRAEFQKLQETFKESD
jgi:4-amino-4-deoxy-L-arabinose transferase-like glycosyltransferase